VPTMQQPPAPNPEKIGVIQAIGRRGVPLYALTIA